MRQRTCCSSHTLWSQNGLISVWTQELEEQNVSEQAADEALEGDLPKSRSLSHDADVEHLAGHDDGEKLLEATCEVPSI